MGALALYLEQNRERHLDELCQFLSIPSISSLSERRGDVADCAQFVVEHLRGLGMAHVEMIETSGHPIVYAEWLQAPNQPTLLVYGHYDVQPVDPVELWTSPPFQPTVRGGLLFARGASDDKGQVFMHWKAIEAHLAIRGKLPINVKLLFEGEEEIGSPSLPPFIAAHREKLAADAVVVSDTSLFAPGQPALCYGLRGLSYLQIDVRGPAQDLHSGSYGGAVANPIQVLAGILCALKDERGHITIPGFYDDVRPISEEERVDLARLPFDEQQFLGSEVGAPALFGEEGYTTLERLWTRPAMDANGIWGGFTGEGSKTVLPSVASAKVSCRLVPDQDPDRIAEVFERHVRRMCPPTVTVAMTRHHGARPVVTPRDHPAVRAASRALEAGFGRPPVFVRTGGSIPVVATFAETLGLPCVLMGIAPPDDHAHAPDERLDLASFYAGERSAAFLLEEIARQQS